MERVFYKKSTAILFIASILVVVLLLCALLTTLVQLSAVKERIARFEELLAEAGDTIEERQRMLEYLQTDDYVRKWAEANGRLNEKDIQWLEEQSAS